MYVVVGCSSTHNKLGLAPALFIIIIIWLELIKIKNLANHTLFK